MTMPAAGQLYLGINDDEVSDNRGESHRLAVADADAETLRALEVTSRAKECS